MNSTRNNQFFIYPIENFVIRVTSILKEALQSGFAKRLFLF